MFSQNDRKALLPNEYESLQAAIDHHDANAASTSTTTIHVFPGVHLGPIRVSSGRLRIIGPPTKGDPAIVIDADEHANHLLHVAAGACVSLSLLSLRGQSAKSMCCNIEGECAMGPDVDVRGLYRSIIGVVGAHARLDIHDSLVTGPCAYAGIVVDKDGELNASTTTIERCLSWGVQITRTAGACTAAQCTIRQCGLEDQQLGVYFEARTLEPL